MKARQVHRFAVMATVATLIVFACFGFGARPAAAQTPTVLPIVDCVEYDPGTNVLTGHFGYINSGPSNRIIPVSSQNFFTPAPDDRGQPTSFKPGHQRRVFEATLDLSQGSELIWSLSGIAQSAKATNDPALYCDTDVSLAQSAASETVLAGEPLTYTLTVTNNGPVRATGVTVRDPLPGGVELVSAKASQGTCSGTDTITCEIGALDKDQSAEVTIVVRPGQPGTLINTASVSSTQPDPDVSNNTATTRTTVAAPPNTTPKITALSPKPGSKFRDTTPTIRARVSDKETLIPKANITLYVDSRRVERFSFDGSKGLLSRTIWELKPGRHTVLIIAEDGQGLSDSRSWGFRVSE